MLFIEDRVFHMNERLKQSNFLEETQKVIELCEDWWELSQEETMLQNLANVFKEPRYKS